MSVWEELQDECRRRAGRRVMGRLSRHQKPFAADSGHGRHMYSLDGFVPSEYVGVHRKPDELDVISQPWDADMVRRCATCEGGGCRDCVG